MIKNFSAQMEIILWQTSDSSYVKGEPFSSSISPPVRPTGRSRNDLKVKKKKERREIPTLMMSAGMFQRA
jgi:hypothetical protein